MKQGEKSEAQGYVCDVLSHFAEMTERYTNKLLESNILFEEDSLATAPVQVQSISPLIFRSTGFDSSGSKSGCAAAARCKCGCRVQQRCRPLSMFGEVTLQLSPSLIELFR
ncbi:hypothetical protein TNCV_4336581 [Trichonephila clavipes]|nr:hypothetical protein TNCV_4336581 [Trichonephila clavipes]